MCRVGSAARFSRAEKSAAVRASETPPRDRVTDKEFLLSCQRLAGAKSSKDPSLERLWLPAIPGGQGTTEFVEVNVSD